jgi:flavin reductase (DIM6/NTAB) family NADH-FMN oxidoreductase RutF
MRSDAGAQRSRKLPGLAWQPQICNVGLRRPQMEVAVWLHGMGEPRDVTQRHSVACLAPFMVCIGFEGLIKTPGERLSLRFCERGGEERLLGEIRLRFTEILQVGESQVLLFEATSCMDFCLPRLHLYLHDLHHAYLRWRNRKTVNVKMTALTARCNAVAFICPRPVVLVCLRDGERGNVFPMNLMGTVGKEHLVFALNTRRRTASAVERLGEAALSSVPFDHLAVARAMGKNHYHELIDLSQLPFPLRRSEALDIPVPEFASRVRELKIEMVRHAGSHAFFVARIVQETNYADGPEFCMTHGLYEMWRLQNGGSVRPLVSIPGST